MRLKLTINELSKIVDVSPRTLRYYDSIGIFKHSGVFENGYRFYTIEKIEEIRLITYLRHLGISLKEVKNHLENRSIFEYETILKNQLEVTREKIQHFQSLEKRLLNRMASLEYIHNLPEINKINIEDLPSRKILRLDEATCNQYDLEKALLRFEKLGNLPPSLIIGDQGFIVDLKRWDKRKAEEFAGMYMPADDPYIDNHILTTEIPAGKWLTVYLKGDHTDALKWYKVIMDFAETNNLTLGDYALERILIDHYISNDSNFYITEIQIPILD